jgi:type II secretion system protein H
MRQLCTRPARERAHPPGRCGTGFTLIELLVVLTILVIMAAIVAPSFTRQYHVAKLNSGARAVVALMQYARSQAVVEGTTYRLNVDQQNQRLWVTYYDATADQEEPEFVPDESVLGGSRRLPEEVNIRELALGDEALAQLSDEAMEAIRSQQGQLNDEGTPYIVFTPQGTTDGARVLLENGEGDRLAVTLDAITGRTEIVEVEEDAA